MKKRLQERYIVLDGDISMEFDNLQEARHYARANGCRVWDAESCRYIYDYCVAGIDF